MKKDRLKQFHIRYIVLKVKIQMLEDCMLPVEKTSALRGGFGNALLDLYCISSTKPPDCGQCSFCKACTVQNVMYAPLKIPASSVQEKGSEGYVMDCKDKRSAFYEGDILSFSVTLFGDVIVHLQAILQAFYRFGACGIGKEGATFELMEIKNQFGETLFEQGNVFLKKYQFQYLDDYIFYRMKKLQECRMQGVKNKQADARKALWNIKIKLLSPLTVKYQGELLKEFHTGGFLNALSRRVYIMNCFEGQEDAVVRKWKDGTSWEDFRNGRYIAGKESEKLQMQEEEYFPDTDILWEKEHSIKRYSSTQQKKMLLKGITGEVLLCGVTEEMLYYLLAGEILHAGKYTSFGFGSYCVEQIENVEILQKEDN